MKRVYAIAMMGAALTVAAGGCSSIGKTMSGDKSAEELNASGPTVLNARANPETVELNQSMQPVSGPAEILAEVKDFTSPVEDVRLRFLNVPIEIKMSNAGGSTWRGVIPPNVVKQLAIGSQTTQYQANIYAKNKNGQVAVSKEPVQFSVTAPDLGKKEKAKS